MSDDHRIGCDGDDDVWADEGFARDRIAALAKGFRRLSDDLRDHAATLDRRYRYVARLCIAAAAISLATLIGTVLIERRRERDETTRALSAATYRVCQREAVDRAYAHSFTPRQRLVKIERSLPILDCAPNAQSRPARPLSSARQRAFVRRFVAGELTLREQGICRGPLPTSPEQPIC